MLCCAKKSKILWLVLFLLAAFVLLSYRLPIPVIRDNWWVLLFLACPLMHLFGGHGMHGEDGGSPTRKEGDGRSGEESDRAGGRSCH